MFLKVHDTVQFHVVHPAAEKSPLADKLFVADPVTYPAQANETIQQHEKQKQGNDRRHTAKRHTFHATVHQSRHAHEYQWQFVDDELPGVRAQDNVPDILYGIWHGHRRKCICRSCPVFSSFSDSCPTVSSRFCSAKSCSFQFVWR